MEKFTRVQNGYNPSEVNQFLDQVISQVGVIIRESKAKEMSRKVKEMRMRKLNVVGMCWRGTINFR